MADKQNDDKAIRGAKGQFLPGVRVPGAGRPKGSRNALAMTVKDAIQEAFTQAGGIAWLVKLAQEEPKAFATLLSKLVPQEQADDDREMVITVVGGFTNDAGGEDDHH